jgi:hypothetical protein
MMLVGGLLGERRDDLTLLVNVGLERRLLCVLTLLLVISGVGGLVHLLVIRCRNGAALLLCRVRGRKLARLEKILGTKGLQCLGVPRRVLLARLLVVLRGWGLGAQSGNLIAIPHYLWRELWGSDGTGHRRECGETGVSAAALSKHGRFG